VEAEQGFGIGVRVSMKTNFSTAATWRRILVAVCLGVSLAGLSGCVLAAAGAGAGAVAYVRGDLEANLDHDYNAVVDAARGALGDLEFARVSENKDALKAVMVSRTAMDKKVEVTIANSGKSLTNIKIRVGVFGDEQVSMSVLERIKARL
jgi:hypothetical protein